MLLKLSTARTIQVVLVASSDHIAGATGKTLTIYASKAGGTPAAITPTVTELDSTNMPGFYSLALTTTHTNTLGGLGLHITASGCDPTSIILQVVTDLPGDSVASVTARVTANADQLAGQTITAGAGVTFPSSLASPTNITAGTITNVTNLTNAPTAGDFTATMKASVTTAATAATPTAAAVTADVGITQAGADKVWATTVRAITDKAGFALSSAGVQAIWDALTSALTTTGSIGKWILDKLDVVLSTRSTYAGGDTSGTTTLLSRLTGTRAGLLDNLDVASSTRFAAADYTAPPSAATIAVATVDQSLTGHVTAGTVGGALNAAGSAGDPWSTPLPGAYSSGTAGYILGNRLDVVLSTRMAGSAYSAPPSAVTIAAATWDLSLTGHTTTGTAGAALNAASAAGDPWSVAVPGSYGAGTAGAILASRSSQTSVDAVGAKTTNLPASPAASTDAAAALAAAGYTSTRAAKLDNADVATSTRSTYAGADTSGTTTLLALLTSARAANLDHLDVDSSTLMPASSYVVPDNASIAAIGSLALMIKAKTDGLPSDPADASDIAAAFGTVNSTLGTLQTALTAVGVDVTAIPDSVWGAVLTESYAAVGDEFTPAQALYMIFQLLGNREVVAALLTAYKLDGTTPAMTFTLNDATVPTAQTRAT